MKAAGAVIIAGLVSISCASTLVERRGPAQVLVAGRSYAVDLPTMHSAILRAFTGGPAALHGMRARELAAEGAFGWVDPGGFLRRYQRLPAADRAHDLLIEEATGDVYWDSEYWAGGQPVRFRCGFIAHLRKAGPSATEVQIYEKVPEVWAGEHWAPAHHGVGFAKVHDIRFVEPTVRDRMELLDAIGEAVNGR